MKARASALPLHSGLQGLEGLYKRHGIVAFSAAVDLHLLAVAAYLLTGLLAGSEPILVSHPGPIYIDRIAIPASPSPAGAPRAARGGRPGAPRRGVIKPVAVPPALDDSAILFGDLPSPVNLNPGGGVSDDPTHGVNDPGRRDGSSDLADLDTVIVPWVERPPIPVRIVKPIYPEVARRIGLEGTVLVRVLVEKDGWTSRASILKSNTTYSTSAPNRRRFSGCLCLG